MKPELFITFLKRRNRHWMRYLPGSQGPLWLLVTGMMLFFGGCSVGQLGSEASLQAYEQGEYISAKAVGPFGFQLGYIPAEALVIQEHGQDITTSHTWDSLVADRREYDYYTLRIISKDSNIPVLKHPAWRIAQYQERVQYMAFSMQKDLHLLYGSDTSHCVLYHFERSYDVTPFSTLMLAFPATTSPATFLYDDKVFGLGPVHIPVHRPHTDLFTEPFRP